MSGNVETTRFKYLSLAGGGGRGLVYPTVINELERLDQLQHIQGVSGTSAGAMTAAALAAGADASDLAAITAELNFKELLSKKTETLITRRVPDAVPNGMFTTFNSYRIVTETKKSWVERSSAALLAKIQEKLRESILDRLQKLEGQMPLHANRYISNLKERASKQDGKITFADLARLSALFPGHFKKLYVNAVEINKGPHDGKSFVFSAETTPDVGVAQAVLASASIPYVIEPAKVVIKGQTRTFIDGAAHRNLPHHLFTCKDVFNQQRQAGETAEALEQRRQAEKTRVSQETILCTFGTESFVGRWYHQKKDKYLQDKTGAMNFSATQAHQKHFAKVYERHLNGQHNGFQGLAIDCSTRISIHQLNPNTNKRQAANRLVASRVQKAFGPRSDYTSFMNDFWNRYTADTTFGSIYKNTLNGSKKAQSLFSYRLVNNFSSDDNIIRFIKLACVSRSSNSLKANTRAAKAFIAAFNNLNHSPFKTRIQRIFRDDLTVNFKLSTTKLNQFLEKNHTAHASTKPFKEYMYSSSKAQATTIISATR